MEYSRPPGDASDLTCSGVAVARPNGIHANFGPEYVWPHGLDVNFIFQGFSYVRPAGAAADFGQALAPGAIGTGAAALALPAIAGAGVHGIAGTGALTLGITAAGLGTTTEGVVGASAVTIMPPTPTGQGAHGAAAQAMATTGEVQASGAGAHGTAGVGHGSVGPMGATGAVVHGVSGMGAAAFGATAFGQGAHGVRCDAAAILAIIAAGSALHPRYSLKGEVRDGAVLVNRMVRAYRRDTGALIGEQATTVGRFDIHAGFAPHEHYILPIDLSDGAADFTPPTANRVVSVLAED